MENNAKTKEKGDLYDEEDNCVKDAVGLFRSRKFKMMMISFSVLVILLVVTAIIVYYGQVSYISFS